MWQKENDANEFIRKVLERESKTVYGKRELSLGMKPEFCVDLSNHKSYSKVGLHKVYINGNSNKIGLCCDFRFLRQLENLQGNTYYIPSNADLYIVNMTGYDKNVLLHLPENISLDKIHIGKNVTLNGAKIYKKLSSSLSNNIENKLGQYSGCTFEYSCLDCTQKLLSQLSAYNISLSGDILRLYFSNVSDILSEEVLGILHRTSLVSYRTLTTIKINQKVSLNDRDNVQWLYKVIGACKIYMKYTDKTNIILCLKDSYNLVTDNYKRYIMNSLARYDITIPFSIEIYKG